MEWLRPSSARSNVITSASARDRMPRPCCVSCRRGSHITTRFTRPKLSVIVHPVSSSQLTKNPDRVRSFGGYNSHVGSLPCEFNDADNLDTKLQQVAPRAANLQRSNGQAIVIHAFCGSIQSLVLRHTLTCPRRRVVRRSAGRRRCAGLCCVSSRSRLLEKRQALSR